MITVGVLGRRARATVDARGTIVGADGARLSWWVAADDRWHHPEHEPNVRQRRIDGTPVVDRVRIPGGDAVQRVYAVADAGGLTIVEIENESPGPIAVALSHGRLLTSRPPADVPIEGIAVPADAVVFPVGHHSTVRVGLADPAAAGQLPAGLPAAEAVARGWTRHVERASRLGLPDQVLIERVTAARCELALAGPVDDPADAAASLIGFGELVRLGHPADELVARAVTAAERLARSARTCGLDWGADQALAATERLLVAAHDRRAAGDVALIRGRLGGGGAPMPTEGPAGIRIVPWVEGQLARAGDGARCTLLPDGHPPAWLGQHWEAHHLPAGPASRVSYAVRWHGARPAVLWEVDGEPVSLVGGAADPAWHTTDPRGEALWSEPA